MEILRLYQGYLGNRNNFFAPGQTRKGKTSNGSNLKGINQPALIRRIVTSKSRIRSNNDNRITPETLSFHLNRNKLALTPNPRKVRASAGIQTNEDSGNLNQIRLQVKILKRSNDSASSKHSKENILLTRLSSGSNITEKGG